MKNLKKNFSILAFLLFSLLGGLLYFNKDDLSKPEYVKKTDSGYLITGFSHLYPTFVSKVIYPTTTDEIKNTIKLAKQQKKKVSIMGAGFCLGGQNRYPDGFVINTKNFNKILHLDQERKILTVQSGILWRDILEYLAPMGLSLKTTQTLNVFSVGGSLGANIHGRSIQESVLIDSIVSFRMILSDGSEQNISRKSNPELFFSAIGGYGLLGVITEVDIELTDDAMYKYHLETMNFHEVGPFLENHILTNDEIKFMHIELNLDTWDDNLAFFKYLSRIPNGEKPYPFVKGQTNFFKQFLWNLFANLARRSDFFRGLGAKFYARSLEEKNGKEFSRNTYLGEVASNFWINHESLTHTDYSQEYFIPIRNYTKFLEAIIEIEKEYPAHLIDSASRLVKGNSALLSYAKETCLSVVLVFSAGSDEKSMDYISTITRKLVDKAIENGGSYYLTYQLFPTKEQLLRAYPKWPKFVEIKKKYDPEYIFDNLFFSHYEPSFASL